MSSRLWNVCALSLLALGSVACQAQGPAGLSDADRSAIRQAADSEVKAANAKDWGSMVMAYADDATIMPPNGEAVHGRQPIQKWMEAFPPISDFKIDQVEVDGRGDVAYVRGNYSMTVTPPGSPATPDRGKFLEIWRKQADGSWKIRWDTFNSDLAPAK